MSEAGIQIINSEHVMIHNGQSFVADHYLSDLDIATPFDILIDIPENVEVHLFPNIECISTLKVEIYEGTITTASGTNINILNRKFNSDRVADTNVSHTPTITADGTLKRTKYIIASASGPFGGISNSRDVNEIILKENTQYLIRLTTIADNNEVDIELDFYEERE